ncbi:hypothetical protein THAOC_34092 [Thalassiosira oceanica]|uniref:Uncharacterized protein n=1 Tax=Thalassiosira oceanica TaxID=159749 RepID=K0R343_THAOC|nr:hypothetical protein THAOC_34092 [Thalassiosira oceanica]|eukprot:EJK47208.1 hypothetical protein THAOC_34092 [Thalassiosira oceanica]
MLEIDSHVLHAEPAALDEIHQPSRRRHEQVASALDLAELLPDLRASVHDHAGDARAVEELLRLLLDLARELSGRREDEALRVRPPPARSALRLGPTVLEHGDNDGEEEPGRLSRTSLGARHEVAVQARDGDAPLLHGRGARVAAELDVAEQILADNLLLERFDGQWHVGPRRLHGDVIVGVEVDAGHLLYLLVEELSLEALVGTGVAVVPALVAAGLVTAAVPSAAVTAARAAVVVVPPVSFVQNDGVSSAAFV